jgi:hypothetical protein
MLLLLCKITAFGYFHPQKLCLKFSSDRGVTMYIQIKSNQEILDKCKDYLYSFFNFKDNYIFTLIIQWEMLF